MTLTITTYASAPEFVHGWVRDIRPRWACEEAGLAYTIDTVPIRPKSEAHRARQPFAQVPMLQDGDLSLFESGAITLHIAAKSPLLTPESESGKAELMQWAFAAVASVEPQVMGHVFASDACKPEALAALTKRLTALEPVLAGRVWLVENRFSAADILMADILRHAEGDGLLAPYPALAAYVTRATARPAFRKAHADQMAHFTP